MAYFYLNGELNSFPIASVYPHLFIAIPDDPSVDWIISDYDAKCVANAQKLETTLRYVATVDLVTKWHFRRFKLIKRLYYNVYYE